MPVAQAPKELPIHDLEYYYTLAKRFVKVARGSRNLTESTPQYGAARPKQRTFLRPFRTFSAETPKSPPTMLRLMDIARSKIRLQSLLLKAVVVTARVSPSSSPLLSAMLLTRS